MSWREIKKQGDIISSVDWNDMVQYIIRHRINHEIGGEQEIDHDRLKNYDTSKHRKINLLSQLEVVEIEL